MKRTTRFHAQGLIKWCLGLMSIPQNPKLSHVPATTLSSLTSAAARCAPGLSRAVPNTGPANASRNARSFILRWGMLWKVPINTFRYHDDGKDLEVPYISPLAFVKYLLERGPEVLFGGLRALEGQKMLKSFWASYEQTHKSHEIFREHQGCTSRVIPFCLHGDEGRGLKKTNTCILMLESVFGLSSADNKMGGKHFNSCRCCSDRGLNLKGLCETSGEQTDGMDPEIAFQEINLQHHPFLTKFILCALPHVFFKQNNLLEALIRQISSELRQLFYEGVCVGGTYWFGAVLGLKGDLAWFSKIGKLTRCYKFVGGDQGCCHYCHAGSGHEHFEDISRVPSWSSSIYFDRPWLCNEPPMFDRIPFDATTPERILRRDFFHCSKIGTFRDFIGSSVLLICRFGYFNQPQARNNRQVLLQRAFGHFRLWCSTVGKHPAMHSFSQDNFNCSNAKKYPWCKTKGSDTMLLMEWLQYLTRSCLNNPLDEGHVDLLEKMNVTACAGTSWAKSLYRHGWWLSRKCAKALADEGHLFLKGFNSLAHACVTSPLVLEKNFRGFGMKPKLHLLCHDVFELREYLSDPTITAIPNPLVYGCESNEDVIGKCSRIIRRVHQKQAARTTLERCLMKSQAVYKRFLQGEQKQPSSRKRKRCH